MNKKVWTSLLVIGLAVLAIAGGTLAWFTAQANIEPNVFTAGTVEIEADETVGWEGEVRENWNPGDCDKKEVWVKVTGSKGVYLRAKLIAGWFEYSEQGDWVAWDLGTLDDPVIIRGTDDAPWPTSDWVKIGDWYYFASGRIEPSDTKIDVISKVCLSGDAGNDFQGKQYQISFDFEAIQTTHEAAFAEWGVGFVNGAWHAVVESAEGVWTCQIDEDTYAWDPATQTWSQQVTP